MKKTQQQIQKIHFKTNHQEQFFILAFALLYPIFSSESGHPSSISIIHILKRLLGKYCQLIHVIRKHRLGTGENRYESDTG